jgi:hypothetical protein
MAKAVIFSSAVFNRMLQYKITATSYASDCFTARFYPKTAITD